MRAYDIIHKKRSGGELSKAEIYRMVHGFALPPNPKMPYDPVPDYQMAALLMAICFQGMTPRETADLTMALIHGGDQVDLSGIAGKKVDKHSTGGVGDKTTLVLIPLVAAAGAKVAKMSGRGLGHTGGTLDKLESIPGFHIELSSDEFVDQVNRIGAAVVGQSANLCPADQKLYALRDVTATVESIPLIASSIMSKKLAGGAEAIVLDVKVGSGAFMKTMADAEALAQAMVEIGRELDRETVALITEMEQPLGFAVGNALEVAEAIETLSGRGPADLRELCLALGSQMLLLAGVVGSEVEARERLLEVLANGAALAKFKEMVAAQGGSLAAGLPKAPVQVTVVAEAAGYVGKIDALGVGNVAMKLGAGRETKEAEIDLSVGVVLQKKVGDPVAAGEPLAVLHASSEAKAEALADELRRTFTLVEAKPATEPLIKKIIR